jgi:hypothetical protein
MVLISAGRRRARGHSGCVVGNPSFEQSSSNAAAGRNNSTVTYVRRASGQRRKKQPSKAFMSAIDDIPLYRQSPTFAVVGDRVHNVDGMLPHTTGNAQRSTV